jgi:two-component system chemotaxis response regulator CheB
MRKYLREIFEASHGFEVITARNGVDALAMIHSELPDVVTLDINMPEMDGLTCLGRIMTESPRPVVMVSSLTSKGAVATLEALELGAVDYVAKPGGTVSLNLGDAAEEIVRTTRAAARAKVRRAGNLGTRLQSQRQESARAEQRRPSEGTKYSASGTALVLIGSSTGGPAILPNIIGALPADFPAPIVIAQHIPAGFSYQMAIRIDAAGPLSAEEVSSSAELRPGHVYIGKGDADLIVARRNGVLVARSVPMDTINRWHPSVTRLVNSAMDVAQPSSIVAVQLTGMGDDGAEAITRLHKAGGRTVAESEESAVVWGMPGELVKRGGATKVLNAERVAEQLRSWV